MISEQEFIFPQNINDIYKNLYEKGSCQESNIIIKYFGNKNQIPLEIEDNKLDKNSENEEDNKLLNPEDPRNSLLFIKYDNTYIGAISINDIYKRENFGLNIYSNNCFYIGRWKENMKEGIGFLKINENIMYVGNFTYNQFNGFGILYDKNKSNFFFGNFNNGEFSEGLFYNMEKDYFYRGKIKEGKKNDELCTFFDAKNGYLFIGEIIEDEFNKGYIFYVQITEENQNDEDDEIKFNILRIKYFDGLGTDNKRFYHENNFTEKFYSKLQDIGNNIFQSDFNLKDQEQNLLNYFSVLNNIKNIDKYYEVNNYNSFSNEHSLEDEFITYYYNIFQTLQIGQENLNLKEYEQLIDNPEIFE
jgi:hypothetical protein